MITLRHFIGGRFEDPSSGETFESVSPIDNAPIATVPRGNAEDVNRAVTAARDALPVWGSMAPAERRQVL